MICYVSQARTEKTGPYVKHPGLTPTVNPAGWEARAPTAFPKGEGDFLRECCPHRDIWRCKCNHFFLNTEIIIFKISLFYLFLKVYRPKF